MNVWIILPVVIPLVTAALCLVAFRSRLIQRWLGAIGTAALLGAAIMLFLSVYNDGIQVMRMGNWPAPFGISFVADLLSSIMVLLAATTGFAVAIYSLAIMDKDRESYGYYPLFNILLMGVSGAFLTGDLFNLYVWFEVMLIASFVLLALGGERPQLEGAIKYVTLNLMSSTFFLTALGILYGVVGTLNMADLGVKLADTDSPGLILSVSMLFLVAFGIKAGLAPLFFWLPASYHTPPITVTAIFAGLLTKVGVYSLIRVFTLVFTQDPGYTHSLLLIIAGLTMVTGVLGAVAQNDVRRLLSFHIISQIGYLLMGLALFTPLAFAATVFFMIHIVIVKANLLLIAGIAHAREGSYDLKQLGGLYQRYPFLSILFLLSALSLAGLPPFSGFFGKFLLIKAGLTLHTPAAYTIVAVSLMVSMLTLFSMTKIWANAFWKPKPAPDPDHPRDTVPTLGFARQMGLFLPVTVFAALALILGLAAHPVYLLSEKAAEQLVNPQMYIDAVLLPPLETADSHQPLTLDDMGGAS